MLVAPLGVGEADFSPPTFSGERNLYGDIEL